MAEKQVDQLAKYLRIARKCLVSSRYDEALAHFVCLCQIQPSLRTEIEDEFMLALSKCSEILEQRAEYRKIVACFQEAALLYPGNETLLNNIGGTLFRLGFPDESASFFRQALKLNPDNIHAKQSLENISNTLVERWHFRMLNDKGRNTAYKSAISKAIAMGYDTVLDIGSGSGILSMFAVQAGAKKVYACELSKTMFEVSQDVLKANNMSENVLLVNKKSTEITVGDDIPSRVNLVVTETMDCGLLGEGILKTMSHAWEHLLYSSKDYPGSSNLTASRVIPCGATLYGMAVTTPDIRTQCRPKVKISEISMSSVNIIGGDQLDPCGDSFDLVIDPIEPYTTESLNLLHHGYTQLSDPFVITKYNFCDPGGLDNIRKLQFELLVTESGSVDAIVVWFDLHLDDDINISTSPNDRSLCWEQAVFPVFPHHVKNAKLQVIDNEVLMLVKRGDTLVINGIVNKEFLKVQCTEILYHPVNIEDSVDKLKMSSQSMQCDGNDASSHLEEDMVSLQYGNDVSEDHKDLFAQSLESSSTVITSCSAENVLSASMKDCPAASPLEEDLVSLSQQGNNVSEKHNDLLAQNLESSSNSVTSCSVESVLSTRMKDCPASSPLEEDLVSLDQQENEISLAQNLDFSASVTSRSVENVLNASMKECQAVVPHSYMSRANDTNYINAYSKVIRTSIKASSSNCCEVIEHTLGLPVFALIAAKCNRTSTLITNPAIPIDIIEQLKQANSILNQLHYGPLKLEDIAHGGSHWDIFVTDLIEPSGIIRHQGIEDIVFARGCLLKKTTGVVIPQELHGFSMCIESSDLVSLSRVQNSDNTLGLEIGSFMNEFKVSTQINVDMTTLNFTPLSKEFELFEMDFMCNTDDGLLSLLECSLEVRVKIVRSGVLHALPYWFKVGLDKETTLSTYSYGYIGSHWKQAIHLLETGIQVNEGDEILVCGTVKDSCLVLHVRKEL